MHQMWVGLAFGLQILKFEGELSPTMTELPNEKPSPLFFRHSPYPVALSHQTQSILVEENYSKFKPDNCLIFLYICVYRITHDTWAIIFKLCRFSN